MAARRFTQGYSTLVRCVICQDIIEVEAPRPEGLRNVGNAVFAKEVEGETTGTGHDAQVVADAACTLAAGDIADPMVAVLDPPMLVDGDGPGGGRKVGGGEDLDGAILLTGSAVSARECRVDGGRSGRNSRGRVKQGGIG